MLASLNKDVPGRFGSAMSARGSASPDPGECVGPVRNGRPAPAQSRPRFSRCRILTVSPRDRTRRERIPNVRAMRTFSGESSR